MLYQDYGASTRDALDGSLGRLLDLLRIYAEQPDPSRYFMERMKVRFHSSPADRKMIRRTLAFTNFAHQKKKRETGEPYIIHPISTGAIIGEYLDIRDARCIAGGLGHDVKEDHLILAKLAVFFHIDDSVHAIIDGCNRNEYNDIPDKRERDDAFLGVFSRGNRKRSESSNLPRSSTTMSLPHPKKLPICSGENAR
jgi:hypothetical protein